MLALLVWALPTAWFGRDGMAELTRTYAHPSYEMTMDARKGDAQSSLWEVFVFVAAMSEVPPDVYPHKGRLYADVDGERVRWSIPDPIDPSSVTRLWLLMGTAVGVLYLWVRWRAFGGRLPDWRWDLAVLCVLLIVLSPLVRKAHGVILVFPAAWLVARMRSWWIASGGWRPWARANRAAAVLLAALVVLTLLAEKLPIPVPGLALPATPWPLLLMLVYLALFVVAERAAPTPAP
jgi:hypothetical protein